MRAAARVLNNLNFWGIYNDWIQQKLAAVHAIILNRAGRLPALTALMSSIPRNQLQNGKKMLMPQSNRPDRSMLNVTAFFLSKKKHSEKYFCETQNSPAV